MNRTKFYKKITVGGVSELDFLQNTLTGFVIRHTSSYYRISQDETDQPDLISYRTYGTEKYWWIICLVNGILNPFTDFATGDILQIPDIRDIYDFYQEKNIR